MCPATKTIQDNYEILEEIGRGGMARVYRARQLSLGRVVAIKEIKSAFAASPELMERFKREARTAALLVHENIVQVYNFGEPKSGALFIVMENVEGLDLKTLLGEAGAIPGRIGAIIGREVCRALSYAHGRGLVHRDIKPGNIMVSSQGEVKLMDFGIVREMDSDLTRTGVLLGTPSYMAPEQFLGEEITPASDIFSLGVVLYEILAGQKPFQGDSEASLARKIMSGKEARVRSRNPQVPRKLGAIVHRCLKKDAHKRPGSGEELSRALDRFLGSRSREEDRRELIRWLEAFKGEDLTVDLSEEERAHPQSMVLPSGPARALRLGQEAEGELSKKPAADRNRGPEPPRARVIPADRARDDQSALPEAGGASAPEARKASLEGGESKGERKPSRQLEGSAAEAEPETSAGEWMVKWLWRAILFAIAIMAALIMFLLFNPD